VALGGDAGGGTFRLIDKVYGASGHPWTAVDLTDPGALARAWPEGTMLVWAETPTNPTTGVVDIAAVAEVVHAHGARLAVDNTLATPYLQQPLALGADLVVHSTTGYLGGQSDVVVGFAAVNDADLAAGLDLTRSAVGSVPSPVDCVLVQRGVRTLAVRMDRHCANAAAVAEALAGHRAVERVLWPGLPDHPGHDVARRQMRDFGGMVSFLARGGAPAAAAFCARTEVFSPAGSLAALESLVEHPARRPAVPVGGSPQPVPPGLVRLSVGIESAADLAADVRQALDGLA
jgi:cystathionine gamma-synthase